MHLNSILSLESDTFISLGFIFVFSPVIVLSVFRILTTGWYTRESLETHKAPSPQRFNI